MNNEERKLAIAESVSKALNNQSILSVVKADVRPTIKVTVMSRQLDEAKKLIETSYCESLTLYNSIVDNGLVTLYYAC